MLDQLAGEPTLTLHVAILSGAMIVKLCMMVLIVELYPFIPLWDGM